MRPLIDQHDYRVGSRVFNDRDNVRLDFVIIDDRKTIVYCFQLLLALPGDFAAEFPFGLALAPSMRFRSL